MFREACSRLAQPALFRTTSPSESFRGGESGHNEASIDGVVEGMGVKGMVARRALRLFAAAGLAALAGAFMSGGASAETPAPNSGAAQPAPGSTPAAEPSNAPKLDLTGFRSAHFGMSEAEVRGAILKDFGVATAGAARASQNGAEHTQVLTIKAPDVLTDGGTAEVSYVFGYKTKKLIQVGVLWSKATDEKMTSERLISNADALRAYFLTAGYEPETIAQNLAVPNGVLMFRGSDAAGHTTILLLHGVTHEKPSHEFSPTALSLFYVADVKNPDVFKVQPGKF